jgi:hypothetical protein
MARFHGLIISDIRDRQKNNYSLEEGYLSITYFTGFLNTSERKKSVSRK